MKILMVNKFHYRKGGSETCFFTQSGLFESHGFETVHFSMKNPKNEPSAYERYFVNNIDYSGGGVFSKLQNSAKIIYSFEAARKIHSLLHDTTPDLAHLHVFQHQLSPSIIHTIKHYGIPIIHTAHDLKALCPTYTMHRGTTVCEQCGGRRYYHCLANRCHKQSLPASLVVTLESYLHRLLGSYQKIDALITPSAFFRNKFIEYGYLPERVHLIRNSIDCTKYRCDEIPGDYFLYFGRLSAEKGIMTLLRAMRSVQKSTLLLAGDGPMREEAEAYIRSKGLRNVRLIGHMPGPKLADLIAGCRFSVLPSEWYENSPMSVLESMACARPVVGSNIGGIPEMIAQDETGLLYEPGNSEQLGDCINRLLQNPALCTHMGKQARSLIEQDFSPEENFHKTTELYRTLCR